MRHCLDLHSWAQMCCGHLHKDNVKLWHNYLNELGERALFANSAKLRKNWARVNSSFIQTKQCDPLQLERNVIEV